MSEDLKIITQHRGRKHAVTLNNGTPIHTDEVNLLKPEDREKFVAGATGGRPGIDAGAIRAELERMAGEEVVDERDATPAQSAMLVKLAEPVELWHDADGNAYGTVKMEDHYENWPLHAKGFREWLGREFYRANQKAPNAQAMQDALNVLSGKAKFDCPQKLTAVRLALHHDAIFLDLADANWHVVKVTADGWQVVQDAPIKFLRRRGLLPLPMPQRGGNLDALRHLLNVHDENTWVLLKAWLVSVLRAGKPQVILALNGEQGSGKSTAARMLRMLSDPNKALLRSPPKDERDIAISAANALIVAYDNLSGVPPALADALCRLATGGGLATRELYTNEDEAIFDAIRPVLINGIDDLATRPDLLDRAITITLPAISKERRKPESELWDEFHRLHPYLLGALLDAEVAALKNLPTVKLVELPRMADFACWVVAAESALGITPGAFLMAYNGNRDAANGVAIESSIIGPALLKLLDPRGQWQGTASELLAALVEQADDATKRQKEWPTKGAAVANALRRLASNLRAEGIIVTFGKDTSRKRSRIILIEKRGGTSSETSVSSAMPDAASKVAVAADDCGRPADGCTLFKSSARNAAGAVKNAVSDDADDADDFLPHHSGPDEIEVVL